jgi:hypothetical protein
MRSEVLPNDLDNKVLSINLMFNTFILSLHIYKMSIPVLWRTVVRKTV